MTDGGAESFKSNSGSFSWVTDRTIASAIVVAAVLYQLPTFDRSIVPMDEGHLASVAMWLQDGKLLYRDLHTGIFPGIYHATAILFKIFGHDLIVTRWAEVAVNASIAACLFLAGARSMSRGWAMLAPLLYLSLVAVSFPVFAMFNYSSLSLALSVASLYFLLRYLDDGRKQAAIALGTCLALAVFCKQNFGALAFGAALVGLLWNRRGSALEDRPWPAVLLPIAMPGIAVTLAFLSYFALTGTFADFINATVIQLGGDQMESFNNPIPPVLGSHPVDDSRFVFLYSPPYLFNKLIHGEALLGIPIDSAMQSLMIRLSYGIPLAALGAGVLLLFSGRSDATDGERRSVRVIVVFSLLFFLGIFPSAIWSHLAFVMPPVLLLLGLIGARCDAAIRRRSESASTAVRGTAAALTVAVLAFGGMASSDIARWHSEPMALNGATLYVTPDQAQIYRRTVDYVRSCGPPDEPIFVAPYMPVVYFLAGRSNATRYDLTIPGNVDGQRIIDSLESAKTRCIVYNPVMYPEFAPFRELFPEVSRYLAEQYRTKRRIRSGGETWLGMIRRDAR